MKEFWNMMRRYAWPYKKYIGGSVVLNILSALFNIFSFSLVIPMMRILFQMEKVDPAYWAWDKEGAKFMDIVTHNAYAFVQNAMDTLGPSSVLLILCGALAVMTLLKTACYFGSTAIMVPIRTGIIRDIRTQIYRKILALPLGFFSEEKKGDIIARISGDVIEIDNSIVSSIEMLLKNPILIIFYFSTLLAISWQLTLFTVLFAPLMVWLMGVIGKNLKKKSLEAQRIWSETMTQLEETLGGLRVIKAFRAEDKMERRFDDVTDKFRRKTGRVATRQALAHPVSEFLGTMLIAIVLWFGGTLILREGSEALIDAPTFIYFMIILYSIINPIKDLSKASYGIPKGLASMERVDKILNAENPIREAEHPTALPEFRDRIVFKGVGFRYHPEGKQILEGIDLTIEKGKTIALVGESGAGKTTLVDLIPRFYDICEGSLTIDGHALKDVRLDDLRALIGNVNQDPILFNDTIYNNIAFGVDDATPEQVIEAAKIANAHEFIMEKEEGYQTNIGDRGMKLSGGQRQRLSIARAVLKNPPILILDEATAALDTESERLVQEALDRLMSSRTTIAIAHRLSTIKSADEICVMQDGRIVERGRHEDLIAQNGYYKKLNDMQSL